MDVDLQDPPDLLVKMLEMIKTEKCDCVATRRRLGTIVMIYT